MKVVAIIQARMGSTRLPNKVMKRINGVPMIELLLSRLSKSKELNKIVLATSVDPKNIPLIEHVISLGFSCEKGSEHDVLGRYLEVAEKYGADAVVRITGDCPLIDVDIVDECVRKFQSGNYDFFNNTIPPTYPDGLDVAVVKISALREAAEKSQKAYDREHVTSYIRESGLFKIGSMNNSEDLSYLRWTVDEPEDLTVVTNIFSHFSPDIYFGWRDVLTFQKANPDLFKANKDKKRNEGAIQGTGQKLWKRAKRVIPGGNMLLSKRAEMFLPEQWPTYFSKAKGCRVWDLDNNEYIDMSIMGIGTNTLGYGRAEVDAAVKKTVQDGNMSTLNCPEEVYLAEKLIELHPWADMARFARSGGEANAIAIRIARASSGRDKVAICGYHGWHDWYLSANLADEKSLDGHLLPGLEPNGVPRHLKDSVFPFRYNDFDGLQELVRQQDIGVIKMEVIRNLGPEDNFLHKVRELSTKCNIVLIFDECTSGFRETFGGIHKKYGIEPDMAMFGKALGNGYAITAVIGRREIMDAAQTTFISSTFWTERIGPSAALSTLSVMEKLNSWDKITNTGLEIERLWHRLALKHGLSVDIFGLPSLIKLRFNSANNLAYKTFITQEMLLQGFLAGNSVYVCIDHTPEIISKYESALDPIFAIIRECEEGRDIYALLRGPLCHTEFKRLN